MSEQLELTAPPTPRPQKQGNRDIHEHICEIMEEWGEGVRLEYITIEGE